MKKLLPLIILMIIPASAYASEEASSTIVSHVNASSSNGDSQVTSHTNVTVETNGKTTHYTSDEPNQSIHVQSNNGVSKIEVNGKEVTTPPEENVTPGTSASASPKKEVEIKSKADFLNRLFEFLSKMFSVFHIK
jgi:hypothetical protein